jgi:hypothetical protein
MPVTVAVSVTGEPATEGIRLVVSTVVVFAGDSVSLIDPDVLAT